MRIAHLVNYFTPEFGYTEYYLAKKQLELDNEVRVITSDRCKNHNGQARRAGLFREEGVTVIRLPTLCEFSGNTFMYGVRGALSSFSPQVVHLHTIFSPLGVASMSCKDRLHYKLVADTITGKILAQGLSLAYKLALLGLYKRTIVPLFYDRIDSFFACSAEALRWFHEEFDIELSKIHFIPLAANSELFKFSSNARSKARSLLGIGEGDVIAIYTGKLLPHKRIDTLLYSSAPLIKTHNNLRILLVGEGPDKYVNYLKKIIDKLNIGHHIILHKTVHRTELPSFYSAATFAVWPGHHSISIIEAMSVGLPIIVPRAKWTNHLLEYQNGLDFVEGDIKGLRMCIQTLLEDEELRRNMGYRSRKLVEDKLNWTSIAMKYLEAYQMAIGK